MSSHLNDGVFAKSPFRLQYFIYILTWHIVTGVVYNRIPSPYSIQRVITMQTHCFNNTRETRTHTFRIILLSCNSSSLLFVQNLFPPRNIIYFLSRKRIAKTFVIDKLNVEPFRRINNINCQHLTPNKLYKKQSQHA